MKFLCLIPMALFLSACATQPPQPVGVDDGKHPLDAEAAGINAFRWTGAWDHYSQEYSKLQPHKAFAQSRAGTWGWYTGLGSVEQAMRAALQDCRQYNKEFEEIEPCRIVNVDGIWGAELVSEPRESERHRLSLTELSGVNPDLRAPIHYDYFKPMDAGRDDVHQLEGNLLVPAFSIRRRAPWITDGSFVYTDFPELDIHLVTSGDILLPLERDQLIYSSTGEDFVILSPGKVWRESGDGDWSRGSFPLTFVGIDEKAPYYGVATFLFNDRSMSEIRFQFSQETANWAQFDLWGQTGVTYTAGVVAGAESARSSYAKISASGLKILPWHALEAKFSRSLDDFDGKDNRENISASGLMIDDVFYLRSCRTRAGPHPYCRNMRYGVFSMTKSMGASISMLWLAQKYGAQVYDEKIIDYLEIPAQHDGWNAVTFGNLLDMTSGIGNQVPQRVDYYVEMNKSSLVYEIWQTAAIREKLEGIARFDDYPWGPGEVFRYRGTDTTVLAAAMQAFLETREGPQADFWDSLTREVFAPLGIDRLPVERTIEAGGKPGIPLLSTGMYPTIEEIMKLSRLLQNHGEFNNQQLLHRELTAQTVSSDINRGFPNGWVNQQGGKGHYEKGFWLSPQDWSGCDLRTTGMAGFGGNYIIIMPNGTIGLRLADGHDDDPATWDSYGIRSVSHSLRPFC
ncbi:MAG: serine hydrolase [Gammaproteobacteria bacterium]|nr:serine hydrolase [Gammaproteobacteria bacterium]